MAFDSYSFLPFGGSNHSFYDKMGDKLRSIGDRVRSLWNDYTGNTAVDKQNAAQLELAKYQTQMQEEFYNKYSSPEALIRQYKEAGLNPNLVYGSASAGQGNVPSFSAPQVQRNMSGSDKINKALSSLSAGLGLVQSVFQASAAKEAAQQAAIKTANDSVLYRRNALDYVWDSDQKGISMSGPSLKFKRNGLNYIPIPYVHGEMYNEYQKIIREQKFNQAAESLLRNMAYYGHYYDSNGQDRTANYIQSGLSPYMFTQMRQSQLKYDLMKEIGNTGTYGKLLLSALGLFF